MIKVLNTVHKICNDFLSRFLNLILDENLVSLQRFACVQMDLLIWTDAVKTNLAKLKKIMLRPLRSLTCSILLNYHSKMFLPI